MVGDEIGLLAQAIATSRSCYLLLLLLSAFAVKSGTHELSDSEMLKEAVKFSEQGNMSLACKVARTLLRTAREKSDEEMQYISLRLLAECENGQIAGVRNGVQRLQRKELVAFQALVSASRVANSVFSSTRRSFPANHLEKFVTDLTVLGCKLAYDLRDEGFPRSALRILTHSLSAIQRVNVSDTSHKDTAVVHLYNDICNLLRNFGRTDGAKAFCSAAIDLAYEYRLSPESCSSYACMQKLALHFQCELVEVSLQPRKSAFG
eukprot:750435-Hanusia_phi.AAC.5